MSFLRKCLMRRRSLIGGGEIVWPYADWDYWFADTVAAAQIPSNQTDFPVPLQFTIPELATARAASVYQAAEVLNLPFANHSTDLSYGTAKAAPETAHAVTLYGDAYVNANGLQLDGNGDYAEIADSADLDLSADFTISGWIYSTAIGGGDYQDLASRSDGSGYNWVISGGRQSGGGDQYTKLHFYAASLGLTLAHSAAISNATWQHIALTRSGNTWTLWLDGVAVDSDTNSGTLDFATGLRIGARHDAYLTGTISDFRLINGTALYTSNFTPPTRGKSPYALQDLRMAKDGVALPFDHALRALNPISGVCNLWVRPAALSATLPNKFRVYVGNAASDAPTDALTYPAGWPADPPTATWPGDWSGAGLTADQITILEAAINDPTNFNSVDALLTSNT